MPHRVGMNPIEPEFLTAMRDWTKTNGSLLVFDEVITYRSDYGGLQMTLGVEPDLTAMGKMIGGGFPVGGVAGRADVMDLMNPRGQLCLPLFRDILRQPHQHDRRPHRHERF